MVAVLAVAAALLNPAVTPQTLDETICRPGYTKTIRPTPAYVASLKRLTLGRGPEAKGYVMDHVVPLELGGAPMAPNLRPQPKAEARVKDREENRLHGAVCSGRMTLRDAQAQMLADWPAPR